MDVHELRAIPLFDGLDDAQLGELLAAGAAVPFGPGDQLFREGDHADDWWVLVDGAIELTRRIGREDFVTVMDTPGRWAGGFRAWDDHGVYLATARGATAGRVLRVPAGALRERAGRWFPFGVHLIRGLYGTARSIEAVARQRASVAALGELAAGLAHGINNPAAAAARAVAELDAVNRDQVEGVRRMVAAGMTAEGFAALDALRLELAPGSAALGALAASDAEDELADWLDEHDVERSWELAPALVAAGADAGWCERAAAAVPRDAVGAGLQWVASTVQAAALLADAKESTQRISDLVGALRSYSQMDRASRQHVDVTEGIDSTLAMLGHRLGVGVSVQRDYRPDLPKVDVHAGELNQVWTCLIDNALDAMRGTGNLRVTTRADEGHVLVGIGDDGPGMPPHVVARAFEAFFTTKEAGEGAGLGLDIARRIVEERHGGTITIASEPGDTVVTVRLPVRAG